MIMETPVKVTRFDLKGLGSLDSSDGRHSLPNLNGFITSGFCSIECLSRTSSRFVISNYKLNHTVVEIWHQD